MALIKNSSAAPTPSPFEAMDDDVAVLEREVASAAAPAPAPAAAPAPAPAPAAAPAPAPAPAPAALAPVAVAARTSLTVNPASASAFAKEVEEMRGSADFTYGNYKLFKGINGEIRNTAENKETLGRWVKGTMLAWDDHFEVSPGAETPASKDFVAYSKDGITIDSVIGEKLRGWVGTKVQDYVQYLHSETDYSKADMRRFIDIGFVVEEGENSTDLVGEIIQITLSSSSIKSFTSYQEQLTMKARAIARGVKNVTLPEDPFTFYFIRESASDGKGKSWTKLRVSPTLPTQV